MLERALGLARFRQHYQAAREESAGVAFARRALEALDLRYRIVAGDLAEIPATGPVLIVANHPFGMADGLVLLDLMERRRPDGRIFSNAVMAAIEEIAPSLISVDPYGGEAAAAGNRGPVRESIRWLRGGGMLAAFPAGDVAHLDVRRGQVVEGPWSTTVVRLAATTGATVVPVRFSGRNSGLFQCLGLIHPRARTALLVRELLRKRGDTIEVRIGKPVSGTDLERVPGPENRAAWLRVRTLELGRSGPAAPAKEPATQAPIAVRTCHRTIQAELDALPPDRTLAEGGGFRSILFRAEEAPATMREVGRQREIAFRAVGEGTGRKLDLDLFDEHYLHLILWQDEQAEIGGAYRLGPTDEILERHGPRGLYTTTLFRMPPALLAQLDPALELGRSFVIAQHQRSFQPLLMLWKGIGGFLVRNPRYRRLFGPVSISAGYRSTSTDLIREFLKQNGHWSDLARFVKPMHPPPPVRDRDLKAMSSVLGGIDEVSNLVAELESDGKGVPVLLRQYLRLGAKLLGFNIDPEFGDALDGLVLTDLTETEPRILGRYMGREGAAAFFAHHAKNEEPVLVA
jgi:putative hemolysin